MAEENIENSIVKKMRRNLRRFLKNKNDWTGYRIFQYHFLPLSWGCQVSP